MGAFVAGMAFSTKGQIALVVIGFPILCHLVYTKKWKFLFHWKTLLALMVFAITIAPMLYAYYHQFDLHPEKIIRGRDGRSGIFFIFWEQSFERMSGTGMGKNSSDYFFFFHTFLWIFLPWTIVGILAVSNRFKSFFKSKFKNGSDRELLTLGGLVLIFITISFAQFKLPHYLNITIPLFAILTAAYLQNLYQNKQAKTIKTILGIQYFIVAVMFIACLFICYYVFKFESYEKSVFLGLVFVLVVYYCMKKEAYYPRIITISVIGSLMLNGVMNTHFYPSLLTYQSGSTMAEVVAENKISTDNIYKISEQHTWALDFYNKEPVKLISIEALKDKSDFWVYAYDTQLRQLQQLGFDWDRQFTAKQFRITRLQAKFLDPSSRKKVLRKRHLVHIY
jgi:4-amino-4-deoxy-L-arabinose transferase-like glycosyltransferase